MSERGPETIVLRDGKLWGAKVIAAVAGVSVDTVYRWERRADCPISKPGGRYFAVESELLEWLRAKPRSCQIMPDFA